MKLSEKEFGSACFPSFLNSHQIFQMQGIHSNANPGSCGSDGVHLTKAGYELMGDTIADRLIEIVKPPGMLGSSCNGMSAG